MKKDRSTLKPASGRRERLERKTLGQSLVEFTLTVPILLIMLSGLVEFGFFLNAYLDLVDTTREVARRATDANPSDSGFYTDARKWAQELIDQGIGQITLDMAKDDIVISVFTFKGGVLASREPPTDSGWQAFGNHSSRFTSADVDNKLSSISSQLSTMPDTGVVLVELFYNYNMKLGLPWIKVFVSDPITLHAYAFAPNNRIE